MEAPILKIPPDKFLALSQTLPIIDVRAPKEFLQGHIHGAISLPLFDDEERAVVGTTYTHNGKGAALSKGLQIAGPKLDYFVQKAREHAPGGELLLHCWRGGMRSEAMAWLIRFSGINTTVLEGGYKAYRRFIRESFKNGPPLILLGGLTGSGKTEMLQHLSKLGEQVLDMERLANHKGSAFGALGQDEQPTNEQFENDLAAQWLSLDREKKVWVEDESRSIGKVMIPEPLFAQMSSAQLVFMDVPFESRAKRLAEEYGHFNTEELKSLIRKISHRMGGDKVNAAISALENGNLTDTISLVLTYYDKTYLYGISRREKSRITSIKLDNGDLKEFARTIVEIF